LRVEIRAGADEKLLELDELGVRFDRDGRILLPEVLQVPELAFDLGLDLERLLSLADAPLVSGDHELPHLLHELPVLGQVPRGRSGLGEQPLELGVDVERVLAPFLLTVGLGLEELADLGLLRLP
jgi:hypothetical protein